MHYILLGLKGVAVGAANVVPGVSGATLAVIFRIYDKLIEAINALLKEPKKSLAFLIPFGLGMVVELSRLGRLLIFLLRGFRCNPVRLLPGLWQEVCHLFMGRQFRKLGMVIISFFIMQLLFWRRRLLFF